MTPDMNVALRVLLTAAGGIAVGHGWIGEAVLEQLVGAVLVVGSAAWAWWSNRPQSKEARDIAVKVAKDPDVPEVQLASQSVTDVLAQHDDAGR